MKRFTFILISFLLVAVLVPFSTASAAKSAIKVELNGEIIPFEAPPLMKNGRVLVPVRFVSDALAQKTEWNNKTKVVKISGPKNNLVLTVGSKTAYLNGVKKTLDVPAEIIDGRVFVPLRLVSEIADGEVIWDAKTQTVTIWSFYRVVKLSSGEVISLQWKTGDLYYADKNKNYSKLTTVELKTPGDSAVMADLTKEGNILVSVSNYYGEPMLNTKEYRFYLKNKQIKQQTTAYYYYHSPMNVRFYKDQAVLTDGHKLYLVDDKTGEVATTHDLEQLGGAEGDYSIEAIGENYLLIRPTKPFAYLTLINTKTNEKVLLYKELLSGMQLEYAELDDIQRGDRLAFIKEENHILYFKNNAIQGKDDNIYEYALPK